MLHRNDVDYSVSPDPQQIQAEIYKNESVEATIILYADFPTYRSGVYRHTSTSTLGAHAVKITGWGVENSTPYWLAANSWSEQWGDQGFITILRGNNECGIEENVLAGAPKLS